MTDNTARPAWYALSIRRFMTRNGWSISTIRIDGPTLDEPIYIASPYGGNWASDAARALGIEGYDTMTYTERNEVVQFSVDECWVNRKKDLHREGKIAYSA